MTTSTSATWLFSQNDIQNILGKVDNNASEKGHKALRALPGIVTFEGKTDLHNAEAQQNGTNRLNGAEHKIAQCIDGRQRVVRIHRQRHHDYRGGNRGNRQVTALDFALGFRCGYGFDEVFGRSMITKQLGIKEAAVSRLITKLLQADIIEPVSGYGKGKYRFKSN